MPTDQKLPRQHAIATIAAAMLITISCGLLATGHVKAATTVNLAGLILAVLRLVQFNHQLVDVTQQLDEAYTDPVTGLAVRRVAEHYLADHTGETLTVALVDVDNMHALNATFTHTGGDEYLAGIAQRLTSTAPEHLVARLGGDEFLIAGPAAPQTLAEALTASFQQPVTVGSTSVPVQASVGIATGFDDPRRALAAADLAMFAAKRNGTGIEFYDPLRDGLPAPTGDRPADRRRDRRPTGSDTPSPKE
ncbi:GGDEF domain-containing protein [Cryptosporangium arvum]|uniref:Diguanylate cyclase (GGDEF) domain-containing protein n=1 Tax=Cryptosporangium arvum DSM 44712 TaxID=927661 RepID=A0A010Z3L3_9ACTN|nr:GGDEF domain-containing protein [Cryptosporangium arvum]EXG81988.1 diguanylate cyclase (GGDEF) domain-containing protein [Cryptosporangium arvum DSM 44712]